MTASPISEKKSSQQCNILLLFSKYNRISNLSSCCSCLLHFNLILETRGREWFNNLKDVKPQSVLFDCSSNSCATGVRMGATIFKKKSYFQILRFSFTSMLDWSSSTFSIVKSFSKKIRSLLFSTRNASPP